MDMGQICRVFRHTANAFLLPGFYHNRAFYKQQCTLCLVWLFLFLVQFGAAQEGQIELPYSIYENVVVGARIGNVRNDSQIAKKYPNPTINSQLRFKFLDDPKVNFGIDEVSGILRVSGPLDRDEICKFEPRCVKHLHIAVSPIDYFEIIKVSVEILDENDNAPRFNQSRFTSYVLESAMPRSTSIMIPAAVDNDSPRYGVIRYELLPEEQDTFDLKVSDKLDGSTDLKLVLKHPLNREETNRYQLRLMAYDGGSPAKTGSLLIIIHVNDTNDNPPMFLQSTYNLSLSEATPVGSSILTVEANDMDIGDNSKIEYALSDYTKEVYGRQFMVDKRSGILGIKKALDREAIDFYPLVITAKDKGPNSMPAECTVNLRVLDVNDNAPQITVNTLTTETQIARILENATRETFVAHISVQDRDLGLNGQTSCTLDNPSFRLIRLYDKAYKIITNINLDRESQSQYLLKVTCKDYGNVTQTAETEIQVVVEDINDHSPMFQQTMYSKSITENNYKGFPIVKVEATDDDTGVNAEIHYSLASDVTNLFHIDEFTGRITAETSLDYENLQEVRFKVFARDNGLPQRSSTAQVVVTIKDVNDEPPKFRSSFYNLSIKEEQSGGTTVDKLSAEDPDEHESGFTFSLHGDPVTLNRFQIDEKTGVITSTYVLDREDKNVYMMSARVADDEHPDTLFDTCKVTIYVIDINDHKPVWIYPTTQNNTLHISNKVPVSHIITNLSATDRDQHASLLYSIASGNDAGYFTVDNKGSVRVAKEINQISYKYFDLELEVKDSGNPIKSAYTPLNIVVNKSIDFLIGPQPSRNIFQGTNFIMVVSLACSCMLLTAILIIVILIIRRKERSKKQHKYNCRMEALLKLQGAKEPCLPDSPIANPPYPKTVLSFNEDADSLDGMDKQKQLYVTDSSQSDVTSPFLASDCLYDRPCCQMNSSPPDRYVNKPILRTNDNTRGGDVEVHRYVDTYANNSIIHPMNGGCGGLEHDKDSVHSGDGSNTDSGRGPSEEGAEHTAQRHLRAGSDMIPSDTHRTGSALRQTGTLPKHFTSQSTTLPSNNTHTTPRPQVTFNLPPPQTRFHTFGGGGGGIGGGIGTVPKPPKRTSQCSIQNGANSINCELPMRTGSMDRRQTGSPYGTMSPSASQTGSYNSSPQYVQINTKARDTTI